VTSDIPTNVGRPGVGADPATAFGPAVPVGPTGATRGLFATAAGTVVFRVLSAALATGVVLLTARRLGPAGRGAFVLQITVALFALVVCSLGVNVSARVQLVAAENPVPLQDYVGLSVALSAVQGVICLVLGLTLVPLAGVTLGGVDLLTFSFFGGGLLLQYFVSDALNAFGYTVRAAAVEAFGFAAQLILVVALVAVGRRDVGAFVLALVGAEVFQLSLGIVLLRRRGLDVRPRVNLVSWRRLIVTGLPGIAGGLAQVLTFRIDRYMLGIFLTPGAVGIYSVASTAPEFLRLVPLAVAQPILHRLAAKGAGVSDFRRARRASIGITMVLAAGIFIAAPPAVTLLFGPQFAGAVAPLRILLLAEFGIAMFYMDTVSLMGLGHIRDSALAATIGFALVAVADVALIPRFGINGAAWGSVAAYSMMGLLAHLLLGRRTARAPKVGSGPERQRPAPPEEHGEIVHQDNSGDAHELRGMEHPEH